MNRIKKILGLILVGILLLPLASCSLQHNAKVDNPNYDIKTLVYIGSQDNKFHYYYDKDTKVMYVVYASYNKGAITPLYNPDGSLKLYKESENK